MNISFINKSILKELFRNVLFILISIIIIVIFVLGMGIISLVLSEPSESSLRRRYINQIKRDNQIEELLYFKRGYEAKNNEIVIKLYDGKIIGGLVSKENIYHFRDIKIIDNYKISTLGLNKSDISWINGISSSERIHDFILEKILNKSKNYFNNDLNNFINCYDEIKGVMDIIYSEGRIPGSIEDESKWGDEEELKKYTGYIVYETDIDKGFHKAKICVDIIVNNEY
jgi:hypothetical protein